MLELNKVTILGTLGKDPELKKTVSGLSVCKVSIATHSKQKAGAELTEWHSVVMFDKQADNVSKFLKKGNRLYVEGRLQTRKWSDQNGNIHYTTEIVAENVKFADDQKRTTPSQPKESSDDAFEEFLAKPRVSSGMDELDGDDVAF